MMKNTLNIAGIIAFFILVVDFFGFMAWALSGQQPVDGFYLGAITANILRAIIN